MSIKYYHLAKDEKLPDEFCAIRDVGGEPSEYTFYAPEAENAKLRHDLEEANNQAEEVCIENSKLRELVSGLEYCVQGSLCDCCRCTTHQAPTIAAAKALSASWESRWRNEQG